MAASLRIVCWLVGCLTSQQHARVSQGRICSDNFTFLPLTWLSKIGNSANFKHTKQAKTKKTKQNKNKKTKQNKAKTPYSYKRVILISHHVLLLQKLSEAERARRSECVFWDVSKAGGQGEWSGKGCRYHKTLEGRDVCVCDHLRSRRSNLLSHRATVY